MCDNIHIIDLFTLRLINKQMCTRITVCKYRTGPILLIPFVNFEFRVSHAEHDDIELPTPLRKYKFPDCFETTNNNNPFEYIRNLSVFRVRLEISTSLLLQFFFFCTTSANSLIIVSNSFQHKIERRTEMNENNYITRVC